MRGSYIKIIAIFFIFCATISAQTTLPEVLKKTNNVDSSISICKKKLNKSILNKDTLGLIEASTFLARSYINKSRYAKAEEVLLNALDFTKSKKFKTNKALLILELANVHKYQANIDEALMQFFTAKNLFEESKDWKNYIKSLIDIAEFYRSFYKYNDAQNYIDQVLIIYNEKKINDTLQLIRIYNRGAAIANETGGYDKSLHLSQLALQLATKIKNKDLEATSLNEIGGIYKTLNKVKEAEHYFIKAQVLWFSIGADREALNAMLNRVVLYYMNGVNPKKVIVLCDTLSYYVNQRKVDFPAGTISSILSGQYAKMGDYKSAYKYLQQYNIDYFESNRINSGKEITNITEKYKNKENRKKILEVTTELKNSRLNLEQKKCQNFYTNLLLGITILLLTIVGFLFWQYFKTNKILVKKNSEKDTLIQEIHHRVKNNLQFVSSLISMQIKATTEGDNANTLKDTSRRIKTMALVHEMLYNKDTIGTISIKKYLEELVQSLQELVSSNTKPIKFDLEIKDIVFDVTKCIALGMITSELVSNSIKYAFENAQYPSITISLKQADDEDNSDIQFCVKDNGTGFTDIDKKPKNLGMRLISIFSRELEGDFKFENQNGLKYTLIFKNIN